MKNAVNENIKTKVRIPKTICERLYVRGKRQSHHQEREEQNVPSFSDSN